LIYRKTDPSVSKNEISSEIRNLPPVSSGTRGFVRFPKLYRSGSARCFEQRDQSGQWAHLLFPASRRLDQF
jgi:hypothetical protein